ncbi:uncharacterized protein [Coffea arabica]|uniref:Reverse transcriptase/retrotransposon-derived protein RNase H-like domain-containing protein n=1 Tax=Coffea arabica TaxID=13443 RepID=A0ABM4W327_COFAR
MAIMINRLESQIQGKLPSQFELNPRNVSAMNLRSGKKVQGPKLVIPKDKDEKNIEHELEKEDSNGTDPKVLPDPVITVKTNPAPFPSRLEKSKKQDKEKEILEVFRKVEINIPLLDAIKQVPKYAKFLRDLFVNRRRLRGDERVIVGENVSAVLQRKLPPKCGDPSPLKETGIIIQLANRTNAYPDGLVEDVLVKINDLVFPADFYVLDMDDDHSPDPSPLLLGRPFSRTAQTKIDINKSTLFMEFDGEIEVFETVGRDELEVALTKHLELETTPEVEWSENLKCTIGALHLLPTTTKRLKKDAKPVRQAQWRLNSLMMEVVKNKILKLLDVGIIFAISDSPWVNSVQIAIASKDQEKTIFTCPFGTFAYRRMPFELCNALTTFQKCMVRSFLGYAGFYRKFIKNFSKIGAPLFQLLQNDVAFEFDDKCDRAFDKLKELLTSPPIIQPSDWSLLFEIMCDTSDHAVGAVLGQRVGKTTHVIWLRYLITKKDAKLRLIRWILILQEFDLEIRDKRSSENLVADHLSRILVVEESELLKDAFPEKHLFSLNSQLSWYADLVNYLVTGNFPAGWPRSKRDKLKSDAKYFIWDDPYLWKKCADQMMRRCVSETEFQSILSFYHTFACGGYFGSRRTAHKVRCTPQGLNVVPPSDQWSSGVEIQSVKTNNKFVVNGYCFKHYYEGFSSEEVETIRLDTPPCPIQ